MDLIRRLTLSVVGLAFCLSLAVVSSNAQPGRARWDGNRGQHRGWTQGRHRGWSNRGRRIGWDDNYDNRYRRLSWRERRRLARIRARMLNNRNRYYENGYSTPWERRRSINRSYRYRRNW